MNHDEYLFLHLQVGLVDKHAALSAQEGEEFHALRIYTPLRSGLQARAERVGTDLRLYLRHAATLREHPAVAAAFLAFFPQGFVLEDSRQDGAWMLHSARGPDTPTPFTEKSATPNDTPP